jgi:uncharacterized protein
MASLVSTGFAMAPSLVILRSCAKCGKPAYRQATGARIGNRLDEAFRAGIELFNSRKYFECHEALEAIWLRASGEEKVFLHGLIQIAAAFHHHTRRNPTGARSLLEKGWKKLERFGDARREIDLAGLRRQLEPWRDFLSREKAEEPARLAAPPLPRIGVSRDP